MNPWVIEGGLFGSSIGSLKPKKSILLFPLEDIVGIVLISLSLKYNNPSIVLLRSKYVIDVVVKARKQAVLRGNQVVV